MNRISQKLFRDAQNCDLTFERIHDQVMLKGHQKYNLELNQSKMHNSYFETMLENFPELLRYDDQDPDQYSKVQQYQCVRVRQQYEL